MRISNKLSRRSDLVTRQVEDDYIVYDPVSDKTALLNSSASTVLELCDGTRTISEIAEEIAAVFSMNPEELMADVESVVIDFQKQGFLKPIRDSEN